MRQHMDVTLNTRDIDEMVFKTLVAQFNTLYPTEGRLALKAAMHVADTLMADFEAIATKQAKSEMAKKAAAARYAPPPQNPGAEPTPQAFQTPTAPYSGPAAAPVKRNRRTKAQKAADDAAIAAAQAMQAGQQAAQAPVQQFAPPPAAAPMLQPPPAPQQPAPPPAPTNAELTAQAFPAAPPVQDFATLARQAAAQGVPQFAPPQTPPPTFG